MNVGRLPVANIRLLIERHRSFIESCVQFIGLRKKGDRYDHRDLQVLEIENTQKYSEILILTLTE